MKKLYCKEVVFETPNGTNKIFNAEYGGGACYAVLHTPSGHIELFDHDDNILNAIIRKIGRTKALTCDHKQTGDILKFHRTAHEKSITLRLYLYSKYEGLPLKKVRGAKITILDRSGIAENILDLRKENVFCAGNSRPKKDRRDITVIRNPLNEKEKMISILFPKEEREIFTPYSPELYQMLTSSKFCNVLFNEKTNRAAVVVHVRPAKDGYVIVNLAKFLCVYKEHFGRYMNLGGAVKRFINDFEKLLALHEGEDAAHLNACTFDNAFENLLFMEKETNIKMGQDVKLFVGPYNCIPAVNERDEILVCFAAGTERFYFKCRSAEDYLDLQRLLLGKDGLLAKLQAVRTPDGKAYLTPAGMMSRKVAGKNNKRSPEANADNEWRMVAERKELLAIPDELFVDFTAERIGTIEGLVDILCAICKCEKEDISFVAEVVKKA